MDISCTHVDSLGSTLARPNLTVVFVRLLTPVAHGDSGPARDGAFGVRACVSAYGQTDGLSQVPLRSYLVSDAEAIHGDGYLGGSLLAPARPIFSNKRHFAESAA